MTAFLGRTATFGPVSAGIALTGVRVKNFTIGGEAPDITDDDSNGFSQYLVVATRKGLEIAVEGLTKDEALLDAVGQEGVAALTNYAFEIPSLSKSWTGNWIVQGFSLGVSEAEVVTFSCTIKSDGAYVYDEDSTS